MLGRCCLSVSCASGAASGAVVVYGMVVVCALVGGHVHPLQDGGQPVGLLHQRRLPEPLQLFWRVPHAHGRRVAGRAGGRARWGRREVADTVAVRVQLLDVCMGL